MSTTNFYIELLVIGFGCIFGVIWCQFLFFNLHTMPMPNFFSNALMLLPIAYVIGILIDRFADYTFDVIWLNPIKTRFFPVDFEIPGEKEPLNANAIYFHARRILLNRSTPLAELMSYGRHRARICRGWAIVSLLLGVFSFPVIFFKFTQLIENPTLGAAYISLVGASATLIASPVLSYMFAIAAVGLEVSEFKKMPRQALFLLDEKPNPVPDLLWRNRLQALAEYHKEKQIDELKIIGLFRNPKTYRAEASS